MKNIWLIGLAVFLTACGSVMFSQDAMQLSPTKTAVSIPTTEPQGVLPIFPAEEIGDESIDLNEPAIVYGKSGGFAGLVQEWNIYADGRIENANGDLVGQAEPAEVTAVVMLADEGGFYELDDDYLEGDECCDLITYTLTVTDSEQAKTVSTRDNWPHPPAFVLVSTAVEDLIYNNAITE